MAGLIERETIGPPECPLFYRWTLWAPRIRGRVPFKVMVHRFLPNRQDADVPHDHPRGFLTIVLRGGYDDLVQCPDCLGRGVKDHGEFDYGTWGEHRCPTCNGRRVVVAESLRAPTVRLRRAEHAHMTRTDDRGAWTFVVMGPVVREWGFWREGRWWQWRVFEERFGFSWRCEASGATPRYDRDVLTAVLIYHQRASAEACSCGWSELGASHAGHVADVYERSVTAG